MKSVVSCLTFTFTQETSRNRWAVQILWGCWRVVAKSQTEEGMQVTRQAIHTSRVHSLCSQPSHSVWNHRSKRVGCKLSGRDSFSTGTQDELTPTRSVVSSSFSPSSSHVVLGFVFSIWFCLSYWLRLQITIHSFTLIPSILLSRLRFCTLYYTQHSITPRRLSCEGFLPPSNNRSHLTFYWQWQVSMGNVSFL